MLHAASVGYAARTLQSERLNVSRLGANEKAGLDRSAGEDQARDGFRLETLEVTGSGGVFGTCKRQT